MMWLDPAAYEKFNRTKEEIALDEQREKDAKKAAAKDKKEDKKKGKKADKAAKPAKAPLDFANRKDRRQRLTPNSSALGDYWLSPKGDKLYYVAAFEDDGDLWVADLKEGTSKLLKKGWGYGELVPDTAGTKLFTLNKGRVKSFDISKNEVKTIDFDARSTYSAPAERDYIYSHMKALVNNKFHDVSLHGTDWEAATANYARFLPYINNRQDFAESSAKSSASSTPRTPAAAPTAPCPPSTPQPASAPSTTRTTTATASASPKSSPRAPSPPSPK